MGDVVTWPTYHCGGVKVRIYADDQLDSKVLLGTYQCTDMPGEFRWEPGPLTRAMLDGG